MNIHITNLHLNLIESDIQRMFNPYGEIQSIQLIRDKWNNRSKGNAYVVMPADKSGRAAILGLNNSVINGKVIRVSEVVYDPAYDRL